MKISGFTFIRNAVKFDYPVIASINSILPIVDELVICAGNSEDNTLDLIHSIESPKIKIIHSVWDDSLRHNGRVLAVETDKAFAAVDPASDWAFYIQADEVVHENDLERIVASARKYKDNKQVDGLLFDYIHFYGNYDYVGDSRRWYRHEIRMIKNNKNFCAYRDAQGFRTLGNKKLRVKKAAASIYHYGWVRHPKKQLEKLNNFAAHWRGPGYEVPQEEPQAEFDFSNDADAVMLFKGTHPAVMHQRIAEKNWQLRLDVGRQQLSAKDRFLHRYEKMTGKRLFEYRNYRLI